MDLFTIKVLIDRLERHCVTKLGGLAARYRERDGEFKAQLEKFVPFMLQCSLGEIHVDKYTPPPKWWPNELPFANTVEKPSGMDESRWFSMLKSMVCKCYTHHECEFMLRFCTELSDCPSTSYMFVESWDGTTSLYNKENGRLMVTFRNENREYDKVVETSPRRSLLPKGSTQNAARRLEHERTCNKQLEDHDQDQDQDQDGAGQYFCSEEPPEQPCQDPPGSPYPLSSYHFPSG
ncbi:hypothetical protein C0J52_02092 [Blattella germanica]|nr:hypothetical protein C0J52_02092 [Blattella germanica]